LPDALGGGHVSEIADDELVAPMPGLVKLVRVGAGEAVTKGQPLVVMEAMKMELTLSRRRVRGRWPACMWRRARRSARALCS
jgi:3-methylcrotonyl-CoA carboxylase alpha subunit